MFRDGKTIHIETSDVVSGGMIDLTTGTSLPADIGLIQAVNLEADEALLTGESVPVLKTPKQHSTMTLAQVIVSTAITKGPVGGSAFVTGMCTEIGRIVSAL